VTVFADDLLAGLSARPRSVPPKWFYDTRGSELFEQICALPEYYPTRTEISLLEQHAADIARRIGPRAEIVEFGAGAMRKVRIILKALNAPANYVPIDISGEHLLAATDSLRPDFPGMSVQAVVADFTQTVELPPRTGPGQRVGFYAGSSIGNFDPAQAAVLLKRFASWLGGGGLLVGVDLVKDPRILHAAYNDEAGVTAKFNFNLWARANREAGADFELSQWMHSAFYNAPRQRIEMHLVSRRPQRVGFAGQAFKFDEGDSVHTENSYKYTVDGFRRLARSAGWRPQAVWVDSRHYFSLHWLHCGDDRGETLE
jgi:dimethylhistidine N-methyltransferase